MRKILMGFILSLVLALTFINSVYAVAFSTDIITLYENGIRVFDNSVVWQSHTGRTEVCMHGKCDIGQQYYPITFYKTEGQNYSEEYLGFDIVFPPEIYKVNFDPGIAPGGESCGPNCIGGRIGSDRGFDFDISTGKYKNNGLIFDYAVTVLREYIYVAAIMAAVIFILAFLIIKKVVGKRMKP